jgi:hypothetical protein
MKCPECQADNPDNKKFCRNCGAKLPLVCPQCGSEICLHDHFCGECGHDLKRLKPALYTERSQPKSYTPKYLESAAEAGTVLVSKNTCKLVKDVFEFEYAGKLHLKGKKALQEAYKLIRPIGVENRMGGAAATRGLTAIRPFGAAEGLVRGCERKNLRADIDLNLIKPFKYREEALIALLSRRRR